MITWYRSYVIMVALSWSNDNKIIIFPLKILGPSFHAHITKISTEKLFLSRLRKGSGSGSWLSRGTMAYLLWLLAHFPLFVNCNSTVEEKKENHSRAPHAATL
jgi:hypothetical protein